jgi:hypothetical protein
MLERNAAKVFPDPVGAAINASLLDWIAGQASICTSVGVPTDDWNHSAMRGWKHVNGIC